MVICIHLMRKQDLLLPNNQEMEVRLNWYPTIGWRRQTREPMRKTTIMRMRWTISLEEYGSDEKETDMAEVWQFTQC